MFFFIYLSVSAGSCTNNAVLGLERSGVNNVISEVYLGNNFILKNTEFKISNYRAGKN